MERLTISINGLVTVVRHSDLVAPENVSSNKAATFLLIDSRFSGEEIAKHLPRLTIVASPNERLSEAVPDESFALSSDKMVYRWHLEHSVVRIDPQPESGALEWRIEDKKIARLGAVLDEIAGLTKRSLDESFLSEWPNRGVGSRFLVMEGELSGKYEKNIVRSYEFRHKGKKMGSGFPWEGEFIHSFELVLTQGGNTRALVVDRTREGGPDRKLKISLEPSLLEQIECITISNNPKSHANDHEHPQQERIIEHATAHANTLLPWLKRKDRPQLVRLGAGLTGGTSFCPPNQLP